MFDLKFKDFLVENSAVAKVILSQLGGNRFIMMTGAKNLLHGDNYLSFRIGKNSGGWNYVKITLTPDDLYDVDFMSLTSMGVEKKKKSISGIFADQLADIFTQYTGLYTRL